ncbi:glycosyltransferase family 2 protein [Patescibacteria group bacterium]
MVNPKKITDSKITIIIINWNGVSDTLDCLKSLKKTNYSNLEIIVVDNNSKDKNEPEIIKSHFPKIQLIKLNSNLGFSGGNNLGIKLALKNNADFIVLLNNDTVAEPNFLLETLKYVEDNPDVSIISPLIYTYDQPTKIWFSYGDYYKTFASIKAVHKETNFDKEKIYFVSGCCMMLKSKMLKKIGLFDDRFFAYFEDTDLCIRAKKAGYKISVAEKAIIYHKISQSSGGVLGPIYLYYMTRNNWLFAQKTLSWYEWPIFFCFFLFYKTSYPIFKILIKPKKNKFKGFQAIFKGWFDALRGKYGKANI